MSDMQNIKTLGVDELAQVIGNKTTFIQNAIWRIRAGKVAEDIIPTPFSTRPLRWRLGTVENWLEQRERKTRESLINSTPEQRIKRGPGRPRKQQYDAVGRPI